MPLVKRGKGKVEEVGKFIKNKDGKIKKAAIIKMKEKKKDG
jgi:hypothetical protein